jgi:two-component system chemotaxis sensor kinase CheA
MMDDLLSEFIAETRETLEALAGEIVAWEADPSDRERLDSIFRFVHTVKGSCGFLDLPRLERLSHAAEDALSEVRSDKRAADRALVSGVLAIIDRIGALADAIENGNAVPGDDDNRLIGALSATSEGPIAQPAAAAASPMRTAARTIRLPIELLDRLMAGVSDMVLARNDVSRRLGEAGIGGAVGAAFERLSLHIADMRDAITRTRMQRIEGLFSALPRIVRDVSAELGKVVTLTIDGSDVELDREMIEVIRDPLTHIVRNAIDHGIEQSDARAKAGKRRTGTLRVSARQSGNQILIEVEDDGHGIDVERLTARAVNVGIIDPQQAVTMPLQRRLALIFEPGLSTAQAVTSISGRGVGMDVVRANVERVGGAVELDNRPGQGLRIVLRVPLTLTIIPALTLRSGGLNFALPRSAVEEIVRADGASVRLEKAGGATLVTIRGRRLPVLSLDRTIGRPAEVSEQSQVLVVVRPAGRQLLAIAVDAVLDHEELVVKPAAPAIMDAGIYGGTTLAQSGEPMLLLDPMGLATVGKIPLNAVEQEEPVEDAEPAVTEWQALLFVDLDGRRRAIRLPVVERIEEPDSGAIALSGGRLRLSEADRLLPLLVAAPYVPGTPVRMLRLNDGAAQIGYLIREVVDIVSIAEPVASASGDPRLAGVALVDGAAVELLDGYALFAEAAQHRELQRPLCLLLGGDEHWTREVLRPLVEAAGYRVATPGSEAAQEADLVISNDWTDAPPAAHPDVPVVALRRSAAGPRDSIYRYDRAGLFAALERHAAGGAR